MKIYHTETQADYDALINHLKELDYKYIYGSEFSEERQYVIVWWTDMVMRSYQELMEDEVFNSLPIIKYKAKADEKMKFTKENVYKLFTQYRKTRNYTLNDLQNEILNLDDTPEKVVVPKFVAEFYEECENATLLFLITQLEATNSRSELGKWYRSCSGRHRNGRANAQKVIAKMTLYGYTIEPEKLYYIPLPHLETTDGLQQVLSKRENGTNYFASRPNENLKQRFTKAELEQVPEVYKPYATLIEEEEKSE